jgi:hypothetical protein
MNYSCSKIEYLCLWFFGVVVRNTQGSVILLATNSLLRCGQPEEAEVVACLQGLNL